MDLPLLNALYSSEKELACIVLHNTCSAEAISSCDTNMVDGLGRFLPNLKQ